MVKIQAAQQKPNKGKSISKLIPVVLLVVVATVIILNQAGYITLPNLGNRNVYNIPQEATIGVPASYDFEELIPLLDPNYNGDRSMYTFYLGSGVGFPPMGLVLGINGVLSGTPTGRASKFQVCVKDVGGNSKCRIYYLNVNSADDNDGNGGDGGDDGNDGNDYTQPIKCPVTSVETSTPCHSWQDGIETDGIVVHDSCNCPSDTYYSGTTDVITPGGPWKICICR